jgi:hypothetical protein
VTIVHPEIVAGTALFVLTGRLARTFAAWHDRLAEVRLKCPPRDPYDRRSVAPAPDVRPVTP